ncbi:MAG: triose-phosphate isomerase [Patescibacteria group bacterium]
MKKIIIANWKMQLGFKNSQILVKDLKQKIKKTNNEIVICPDYLSLVYAASVFKGTDLYLGAQDCAIKASGALTGEVSPVSLKEIGANYVIIGHWERRTVLGEDSELINKKISSALAAKLIPVVCIGENLAEREAGLTKKVLLGQIKGALKDIKIKNSAGLVIAYEPIWAIGTGEAIIPFEAEAIHVFIKSEAAKILDKKIRIIYGGSVNIKNAAEFLNQKNVDGLLVGGASLDAREFIQIINN